MNEAEALTALSSMCAATDAPELTIAELGACLLRARRADDYDLNYAAFLGWQLKAGKSASYHGVTMQGRNFDAGAVHDHCLKMMGEYRRYINTSVLLLPCSY